jgi:hypothetical protein
MRTLSPRWRGRIRDVLWLLVSVAIHPVTIHAQEPVSATVDFLFYGDNTEFANPFRRGETLLGSSERLVLDAEIGSRAFLTGGIIGDRRFGGDRFEMVRPVFALDLEAGMSRFVFGTLELRRQPVFGPDRAGPHGLLPPIQRETLSFTRPYEAGLQWVYRGQIASHETWLDWQRLNTPSGREVFDAGVVGRVALLPHVAAAYQGHVVHHGGQLYSNGPVADSWAGAPGIIVTHEPAPGTRITFEAYGLLSRYVPDRQRPDRTTSGAAIFTRGAIERSDWRGHLIIWRSNDFIKEEGDPNYGGLRHGGQRFRKPRDYAEIGLTRMAQIVPPLQLEGSVRLHRIENYYEYSYRILGRVTLHWRIR